MKLKFKRKIWIIGGILCLVAAWLYWDLHQASGQRKVNDFPSFREVSSFAVQEYSRTKVAVVRSDDPALPHPIPVNDSNIGYPEIEQMVRRAIHLAGGLERLIKPGDQVLLKPNIVDPKAPGSGEVTDVRVIKALIKIIHELYPGKVRIVVGEGSPRPMDYELKFQTKFPAPQWQKLWDHAGYQDLLTDPDLKGIPFRLSNLNGSPPENPWADLVEVTIPGGGQALPQKGKYFVHKDILETDVYISVPVLKIHDPGMTAALKNQIGIAPSTIYGFSKTYGVRQKFYKYKLTHEAPPKYWTDKEIVDLSQIARVKFTVVDAIACLERSKSVITANGRILNQVRMNTILAGADPVAVDHVAARLIGLNPDDIEHITLAEKIGLGTNNPEQIEICGASLEKTRRRFIKSSSPQGDYGQSNREWLIAGPFPAAGIANPMAHPFIPDEDRLMPLPNRNGWSAPIYFTDDRIDLGDYFTRNQKKAIPDKMVGYAFTLFDAPRDQEAEFWIGTDEAMRIYLNGELIYDQSQPSLFPNGTLYNEIIKAQIKAGENRLLVKTVQTEGYYHFSLNICEPEPDPKFNGNRIWGLKFRLPQP